MTKSLREEMPGVSHFIDQMREVLGKEYVDDQIRRGMQGDPTFYASENGHTIGTPTTKGSQSVIAWDDQGIAFSVHFTPSVSIWDEIEKIRADRRAQRPKYGQPIFKHDSNDSI